MGNVSIDISLANVWRSWYRFRGGKRHTLELEHFLYYLERNLKQLWQELDSSTYRHGPYEKFIVTDTKRREISVALIRDRIVHRLLYDYLYLVYDTTFIYDAWSCRKDKGLLGAIERTEKFLRAYPHSFIWRADITKFFDSVDRSVLKRTMERKIKDPIAQKLLYEIIDSYPDPASYKKSALPHPKGIPIGNLTSQIFANIYLNELDRFVKHDLKPLGYTRYGDDFILIGSSQSELEASRNKVNDFLKVNLRLDINPKNDIMVKAKNGIHFLGVDIFPYGRRLRSRNVKQAMNNLTASNLSSYYGLVYKHQKLKVRKSYSWKILHMLEQNFI